MSTELKDVGLAIIICHGGTVGHVEVIDILRAENNRYLY